MVTTRSHRILYRRPPVWRPFDGDVPGRSHRRRNGTKLNNRIVRLEVPAAGIPLEFRQLTIDAQDVAQIHEARAKQRAHINMRMVNGVAQEFPSDAELTPDAFVVNAADSNADTFASREPHPANTLIGSRAVRLEMDAHWQSAFRSLSIPYTLDPSTLQTPETVFHYDRVYLDHSYSNPGTSAPAFTSAVSFRENKPTGGWIQGSGQMIGSRTAMTAAHVFYHDAGWRGTMYWATAYVYTVDFTTTYLPHPPTVSQAYPSGSSLAWGCYSVSMPSAWFTGCGAHDRTCAYDPNDWAVVRFDCGYTPGASGQFVAAAYGSSSDYSHANGEEAGYDFDSPYPSNATSDTSHEYQPGSLIGRTISAGELWENATYSWELDTTADVTPGASGSGTLLQLFQYNYGDPTLYWTGDMAWESGSSNGARCLDSVEWSAVSGVVSGDGGLW